VPSVGWKPAGDENPTVRILLLLTMTVGAPYFLLSTTGPLVQRWFSLLRPGDSPFRLYALSNVGSLLALQSYPLVFEPLLKLGTQATLWSLSYGLFALLCGTCAWQVFRQTFAAAAAGASPLAADVQASSASAAPSKLDIGMWLLLSALPSVLLLATTSQISQEVAVVPFLWVLPLSLYLVSFIIAFDNPRWYVRPFWFGLMFSAVLTTIYFLVQGVQIDFQYQMLAYGGLLLGCAMCCHGELAASRPDVRYLTLYYLTISLGGALGGIFVVVIAPFIFTLYWEFHFSVMGCILCAFLAYRRAQGRRITWQFWTLLAIGAIVILISGNFGVQTWYDAISDTGLVMQKRNFYGVMSVRRDEVPGYGERYQLVHGQIAHGIQFRDADKRAWHTSYYSPESGVGLAIELHPRRTAGEPLKIGVVGLGVGTLASYGRVGDTVRFYELNPAIKQIAYEHFSYCTDSPAQVDVILGDARMQMERELAAGGSQQYDVLVIDAFSSDSIPMHLLTRECMALYWQHLKPDGILALHISSHFMDLQPVVRTLAEEAGYRPLLMRWNKPEENAHPGYTTSEWVLVTANEEFRSLPDVQRLDQQWPVTSEQQLIWTDDYGSLMQVLK